MWETHEGQCKFDRINELVSMLWLTSGDGIFLWRLGEIMAEAEAEAEAMCVCVCVCVNAHPAWGVVA